MNNYVLLFTVFVALISVLSAVGICERCRIESGGVYFLIAHVLGSRFGGSLGLLYCFGQVNIRYYFDLDDSLRLNILQIGSWLCFKCVRIW